MKVERVNIPVEKNEEEKVTIIHGDDVRVVLSIAQVKATNEHGVSRYKEVGFYVEDSDSEMAFSLSKKDAIRMIQALNELIKEL